MLHDVTIFLWLLKLGALLNVYFLARTLVPPARRAGDTLWPATRTSWKRLREGLLRSLRERNRTTDATAWGGLVGLSWMTGYFATLLPIWANQIVRGVLAVARERPRSTDRSTS